MDDTSVYILYSGKDKHVRKTKNKIIKYIREELELEAFDYEERQKVNKEEDSRRKRMDGLLDAIHNGKVIILNLDSNYAESLYCLDEISMLSQRSKDFYESQFLCVVHDEELYSKIHHKFSNGINDLVTKTKKSIATIKSKEKLKEEEIDELDAYPDHVRKLFSKIKKYRFKAIPFDGHNEKLYDLYDDIKTITKDLSKHVQGLNKDKRRNKLYKGAQYSFLLLLLIGIIYPIRMILVPNSKKNIEIQKEFMDDTRQINRIAKESLNEIRTVKSQHKQVIKKINGLIDIDKKILSFVNAKRAQELPRSNPLTAMDTSKFKSEIRFIMNRGEKLIDAKEYDEAVNEYKKILQFVAMISENTRISVYQRMRDIYFLQKNWEKAKDFSFNYISFVESNADMNHTIDFASAYMRHGEVFYRLNKYDIARKNFTIAKRKFKQNSTQNEENIAWSLSWIGDTYKKEGRYMEANATFRKSLDIYLGLKNKVKTKINIPWLYSQLGYVDSEIGEYKIAINDSLLAIHKYLDLEKETGNRYSSRIGRCYENLSFAYERLSKTDKAIEALEGAINYYGKNDGYSSTIANIYLSSFRLLFSGNREKAEEYFNLAIEWYEHERQDNNTYYSANIANAYECAAKLYIVKDSNASKRITSYLNKSIEERKKENDAKELDNIIQLQIYLAYYLYNTKQFYYSTKALKKAIETYSHMKKKKSDLYDIGILYGDLADSIANEKDSNKTEVVYYYDKSCKSNYYPSCVSLGNILSDESRAKRDYKRAKLAYEKACENGNEDGCAGIAYLYDYGRGVLEDPEEAANRYKDACLAGSDMACTNWGILYQTGRGVKKDEEAAARLYGKSCQNNYYPACEDLGDTLGDDESSIKDYQKAKRAYAKACKNDELESCVSLGAMYELGYGVKKNINEAIKYYKDSCKKGVGRGCRYLGSLYEEGTEVNKNIESVYKFYKLGCENDDFISCEHYGNALNENNSTNKNYKQIILAYSKACEGKRGISCSKIAYMYFKGEHVPMSYLKASDYYKKACDGDWNYCGCEEDGFEKVHTSVCETAKEMEKLVSNLEKIKRSEKLVIRLEDLVERNSTIDHNEVIINYTNEQDIKIPINKSIDIK